MFFKTEPKCLGVKDPNYSPDLLPKAPGDAKAISCVELSRSIGDQIRAIMDDPDITRAQMHQKLTELTVSYATYWMAVQENNND
jgi:hypothetical protein